MTTKNLLGSLVSCHDRSVDYIEPFKLYDFKKRYSILLEVTK